MCVGVCVGDAEYTLGFDLMLSPVHLLLLRRKSGIFLVMGERVAKYPEVTASNLTPNAIFVWAAKWDDVKQLRKGCPAPVTVPVPPSGPALSQRRAPVCGV